MTNSTPPANPATRPTQRAAIATAIVSMGGRYRGANPPVKSPAATAHQSGFPHGGRCVPSWPLDIYQCLTVPGGCTLSMDGEAPIPPDPQLPVWKARRVAALLAGLPLACFGARAIKMDDQANSPKRENRPITQPCTACGYPMAFMTTIADPLMNRLHLFECPKCRNAALIMEL
jgi:hypothetical protein